MSIFCRVGEASHPGPILGTANMCGLLGKAQTVNEFPTHSRSSVWGLTETHLSTPGIVRFKHEMKHAMPAARLVHGRPAPRVSSTVGSIGGKHTGVGLLSESPIRPLPGQLPDHSWSTSRIQTAAVCTQGHWIKVGVVYGFANAPGSTATKDRTTQLIEDVLQRLQHTHGYRVLCGDFNQSMDGLGVFQKLRDMGWVELQEFAAAKWQQPAQTTFRNVSVVDALWISPELVPLLESVHVDKTRLTDHALLYGVFMILVK